MASGTHISKIDQLMNEASKALAECRYFDAEHLCLQALRKARAAEDYVRMSRIILPLQEARRQKRDLAYDAARNGAVFVIDREIPSGKKLVPGCYLVSPPRVGLDGRLLREAADRRQIPVIVTVREPTTREGLWPIVAVGPVTVRCKVKPPRAPKAGKTSRQSAKKTKAVAGAASGKSGTFEQSGRQELEVVVPPADWFLSTNEAIGDAAIASAKTANSVYAIVQALFERLETLPDHEKLHQELAAAARQAVHATDASARRRGLLTDEEDDLSGTPLD